MRMQIGRGVQTVKRSQTVITQPGRTLLIAEIGNNHGGDKTLAEQMVLAAVKAGADAVKFQTYRTDRFVSARSAYYREFEKERLGEKDQADLFTLAASWGLIALSTPFDLASLDFLIRTGRPALKIASGDITFYPLLEAAGESGLPVLLSTGACTAADVERALAVLDPHGSREVVLLHCTAAYPAKLEDANLRAMEDLRRRFGRPVGLSDHTEGMEAALAAAALGAVVIEKHFTIDRSLPGGDNGISILPEEMEAMARSLRCVHKAMGSAEKGLAPCERALQPLIRRSPHALVDIRRADRLTTHNIALVRPGDGLPPEAFEQLLGATALVDIKKGSPILWGQVR
jgi:sialic acid synthase SpsE